MRGVKHLVQCHCILPQYRRSPEPIFHKFTVFSIIDDEDTVIEKLSQCNNCGVIHKIVDICKSEIVNNFEDSSTLLSIEDIKYSIPDNISSILESHECDIATWEQVSFLVENNILDQHVSISRETIGESRQIKILKLLGGSRVKIETQILEDTIG